MVVLSALGAVSLPQISVVVRRTSLTGALAGVVVAVAAALIGYPQTGLGFFLGLAVALGNMRMITRATVRISERGVGNTRKPMAVNTVARLGVISVIALGVSWLDLSLGFGIIAGIAAFQFFMMANILVAVVRHPMMGDTNMGTALDIPDDEDDL